MDNDRQTSYFRKPKGFLGVIVKSFLCGIPLVGIFYILNIPLYFGQVFLYQQYLGLFLFLLLPTIFILKPATKKSSFDKVPWYDIVLALSGLVIGGYVMFFYPDILNYLGFPSNERFILGVIAVFLVLEGTRRLVGFSMVIIALLFIFYAHFSYLFPGVLWSRGYSWQRIFVYLYLQPDSLLGIPLHIASTMVLGFIFFGQALFITGGGQFINDLSLVVMGRFRGGPAKVAVLGSSLFGMMSGSAVSDVATTGVITIPMMKKIGYKPHVAAAIEAVASSGGAIMPPIMGAAAFVMSEFLNLPYSQIVTAAILPATLYFFSIFVQVDLYAAKADFKGLSSEGLPNLKILLKRGWTFILPIFVLIYCLFFLYLQPAVAGVYSAATVLIVSLLRKDTRISFNKFLAVLEYTGRNMLLLGIICGAAGFIIGMVSLTGLGFVFSSLLLKLAGGNLYILLILTGLGSIILGMGLPVTASYILLVILVAPAIVKLGVLPLSAHLFILYFAILSFITPPVCLAIFTASGSQIQNQCEPDSKGCAWE